LSCIKILESCFTCQSVVHGGENGALISEIPGARFHYAGSFTTPGMWFSTLWHSTMAMQHRLGDHECCQGRCLHSTCSSRSTSTPHTLTDCRHSQFSKFSASSPFLLCAATNKSDLRQIAEASPNLPWILLLCLYLATPLWVLSVTR